MSDKAFLNWRFAAAALSIFTVYGCAGQNGLTPAFNVTSAHAQTAKPPKHAFECQPAPDPVHDIQLETMYDPTSKNSSIVDPVAYANYLSGSKPLTDFERNLTSMANAYAFSNPARPEIAVCATEWLDVWAKNDALNGNLNHMGQFLRKWVLSSVASTWIQVKGEPSLDKKQKREVENWMARVATNVEHDFPPTDTRRSRNNNHMYWAAWSVMATGVALDNRDFYEWSLQRAIQGVNDIQPDGSLSLEIDRGPKAFNYHSYAAIPLFMMAETALQNGTDLYAMNDHALFRLAKLVIAGTKDTSFFEGKTGETQNLTKSISSTNLVWLEPYYKRSHDPDALELLEKYRPMRHSRVGGNLTQFYKP